jgi:hypothetical protein
MARQLLTRDRELIALSDLELAQQLYATIGKVSEIDDTISDELYWLAEELVERWNPAVEFASRVAGYRDDDELKDDELFSAVQSLESRWRARLGRLAFDG